jgi:hypothetical protein
MLAGAMPSRLKSPQSARTSREIRLIGGVSFMCTQMGHISRREVAALVDLAADRANRTSGGILAVDDALDRDQPDGASREH